MRKRQEEPSTQLLFGNVTYICSTDGVDLDLLLQMNRKELEYAVLVGLRHHGYLMSNEANRRRVNLEHEVVVVDGRYLDIKESIHDIMSEIYDVIPRNRMIEDVRCLNRFSIAITTSTDI